MSPFKKYAKKIALGALTTIAISISSISQLRADTPAPAPSEAAILAQIAQYTNATVVALTSTNMDPTKGPVYPIAGIIAALTSLTSTDTATNPATPTPTLQNGFTTYVAQAATSTTAQTTLQQQLTTDFFGSASMPTQAITFQSTPNANDLAFQTLLGGGTQTFSDPNYKAGTSGYNYLKYAAGLNINHTLPNPSQWVGLPSDQTRYTNYFNAITAVQTFDGYALSQLYEDLTNNISAAQTALVNQASDPTNWFAIITNESIGAVLRQTLMYESQSYILLTQLLQTEKMLLAAQAMNNTLVILSGQASETMLVARAAKKAPGM